MGVRVAATSGAVAGGSVSRGVHLHPRLFVSGTHMLSTPSSVHSNGLVPFPTLNADHLVSLCTLFADLVLALDLALALDLPALDERQGMEEDVESSASSALVFPNPILLVLVLPALVVSSEKSTTQSVRRGKGGGVGGRETW